MACPLIAAVKASVGAALDAGFLLNAKGEVVFANSHARSVFNPDMRHVTHISSLVSLPQGEEGEEKEEVVNSKSAIASGGRNGEGEGKRSRTIQAWDEALGNLNDGPAKKHVALAVAGDKSSFPAIVSLTRVDKCNCKECRHDHTPLSKKPSPIAFCAYVRPDDNNTERCQHIRMLEREVMRLQAAAFAVEASFDPCFLVDEYGLIMSLNSAAVNSFGWGKEELVGGNISMIASCGSVADAGEDFFKGALLRATSRQTENSLGWKQQKLRKKDGTEFTTQLSIAEVKSKRETVNNERVFCVFTRELSENNSKAAAAEANTEGMLNASLDSLIKFDEKSGIIEIANETATRVLGWSRHELIGSNVSIIFGDEQQTRDIIDNFKSNKKSGEKQESVATRKDGTRIPIEVGLTEMDQPDGKTAFCGCIRDLTVQKEREKLTTGLIESSFDSIFRIDDKGIILMVNNAAVTQFGWTREEMMGRNISIICGGDDAKKHDKYISRYIATGIKKVLGRRRTLVARRKDGSEFPIELGISEVKEARSCRRYFCGFVRDLTEQQSKEQNLRRQKELMSGILNASFDPIFLIDISGIIQIANQAAVDHFGFKLDELIGSNIRIIAGSENGTDHSKDHDMYIQRYLQSGERHVIGRRRETVAKRKDGSEFPCSLGISEIVTENGEPMFCGFVRDVRREKFDEQDLREKERLSEALFEASPCPVLVVNGRGSIHRANAATSRCLGWPRDRLLGRNIRSIMDHEYAQMNCGDIERYIETSLRKDRELLTRQYFNGEPKKVMLHMIEIEGPFQVLLHSSDGVGHENDRMFAAFLRHSNEKGYHAPMGLVESFWESLVKEKCPQHRNKCSTARSA